MLRYIVYFAHIPQLLPAGSILTTRGFHSTTISESVSFGVKHECQMPLAADSQRHTLQLEHQMRLRKSLRNVAENMLWPLWSNTKIFVKPRSRKFVYACSVSSLVHLFVSPPKAAIIISVFSWAALSSKVRPSRCNPTSIEQRTTAGEERSSSQASQFRLQVLNQFRFKDGLYINAFTNDLNLSN